MPLASVSNRAPTMAFMTGKRRFNWAVFVVGFGLFSLLWRTVGFVEGFLAGLAGVLVVLMTQEFPRRGKRT